MSSPAPERRTNASLRTHRPTTYYDTDKDSSRNANPPTNPPHPPGASVRDGQDDVFPHPTSRSGPAPPNKPTARNRLPGQPNSSATSTGLPTQSSALGGPTRGTPRPRPGGLPAGPGGKSKVGAALRNKRQSVSYGSRPPPRTADAPPIPVMPKLPVEVSRVPVGGPGGRRRNDDSIRTGSRPDAGAIELDMDSLGHDKFDAEKYLKVHLSIGGGSDAQHLKAFKDKLKSAQQATNEELQENVYKNYSAFVAISKEIATLENEMLELKTVLEEFKTLPADLDMGLGSEEIGLSAGNLTNDIRKRSARNSVADVNALYRTQLEALWENVEGSQKFLPVQPGRHLLAESSAFVELNSITYKRKQNVHLFLLNDALLVAISKRSGMGSSKVKLMADRCFNLGEISVVDLQDGGDLENAIKITRSRETAIFKSDRLEDKRALLSSFKKVAEELTSRKRRQSIMEAERRGTNYGTGSFLALPPMYEDGTPELPTSNFQPSKILGFGKDDPTGKDLSWIGDLSDELSVSIACRAYDEASALIEKSKEVLAQLHSTSNSPGRSTSSRNRGSPDSLQYSLLKDKIEVKSQELMHKLLDDLLDPAIRKSHVVKISNLIVKLSTNATNPGLAASALANIEKAKQSFLSMRSELVKTRSRMIKFEGDMVLWVSQLAMVIFTLVKNTCEWYMTAFRDNRMASGFVRWAANQIELFAEIFRRQVYGADQDGRLIEESLAVTKAHASMLKDVGLDFGFLLELLLRPDAHSHLRSRLRRRSMDDAPVKQEGSRRERSLDRLDRGS